MSNRNDSLVIGDTILESIYDNQEAVRDETSLIPSAFVTSHSHKDLIAFAKRIQTLILMEKGSNPGAVGMGVGIRSYVMELATPKTLEVIRAEIKAQIEKYIPNDIIYEVEVTKNPSKDDINVIFIAFRIDTANSAGIKNDVFVVKVDASTTSKLVSDILV